MSMAGGYPLPGVTITTKKKKNKGKKKKSGAETTPSDPTDSPPLSTAEVKELETGPISIPEPCPPPPQLQQQQEAQQTTASEQPQAEAKSNLPEPSAKQGKNKRKQQQNKKEVEDRSRSSSDAATAEPAQPKHTDVKAEATARVQPKSKTHGGNKNPAEENLRNLAIEAADFASKYGNIADLKEAEAKYYNYLAKSKKESPKPGSDSDGIDFFASDEESTAKANPKAVVQKPKQLKKTKDNEKKKEISKVRESTSDVSNTSSLTAEIAKAREFIKNSLECLDRISLLANNGDALKKIKELEAQNKALNQDTNDLRKLVNVLEGRISSLENSSENKINGSIASAPKVVAEDDDDDIDLFGSSDEEDEDAEKAKVREERLKAYAEKKSKKPALIAKTSVLLDVKPWDDETDMGQMLTLVKSIKKDGLVWGADKLVPVGYGINKLQVMCVVEDEKVSIDELCEEIQEFSDYVQSVDINAMSKI